MFSARISLKRSLAFSFFCLTCILLISGCSFPWRHHTSTGAAPGDRQRDTSNPSRQPVGDETDGATPPAT